MKQKLSKNWEKLKETPILRIIRMIGESASFALALSVIFFVVEATNNAHEQKELINQLTSVRESLSTRYLGLFPEYITDINKLLDSAELSYEKKTEESHPVDSIIIFQDVLYYGVKSEAEGFRRMNEHLLRLAADGCQIYIAYYDPENRTFAQMVREALIAPDFFDDYERDMGAFRSARRNLEREKDSVMRANPSIAQDSLNKALFYKHYSKVLNLEELRKKGISQPQDSKVDAKREKRLILDAFALMDSLKCQEYYELSRALDVKKYNKRVEDYLKPIPLAQSAGTNLPDVLKKTNLMCQHLDSIKSRHLSKDVDDVSFADYKNMYRDFTYELIRFYSQYENIHLIRLSSYLTMGCWLMTGPDYNEAIFSFPSKYATEEIGFYSQDENIANYIKTMLRGVEAGL